jgi:hypothetical protein
MPGLGARLLARVVIASRALDSGEGRLDRWRSRLLVRFAPDGFFAAYNDVAYARAPGYRRGGPGARVGLFPWEAEAIDAGFPAPPASILVGGAGGGREALALEARGHAVTSFEPSVALAVAHARETAGAVCVGRYEDLPWVRRASGSEPLDLLQRAPFAAAICGWSSLSHLRTPARRRSALRAMRVLVDGPLLVSYYAAPPAGARSAPGRDWFSLDLGFIHEFDEDEIARLGRDAGWTVVSSRHRAAWPHVLLSPLPSVAGGVEGGS